MFEQAECLVLLLIQRRSWRMGECKGWGMQLCMPLNMLGV